MAFLQQYPDKAAEVMAPVAEKLKELNIDVVVGPAMGGIVYAYELGRQMGKRAIFTERVDNVMTLKRFRINPGERCIIAEDVVTTGVSSLETIAAFESMLPTLQKDFPEIIEGISTQLTVAADTLEEADNQISQSFAAN